MDWDNLRYFLELARTGRLVAAAERLGVDHTTVSRRIQALEQAVGGQIFERRAAGYVLTEAGQRLLAHAEAMENSALAMEEAMSGSRREVSGATPKLFVSREISHRGCGYSVVREKFM